MNYNGQSDIMIPIYSLVPRPIRTTHEPGNEVSQSTDYSKQFSPGGMHQSTAI